MNYCKSCRRHLNGVLSCPGCGAITISAPEAQDSRSTDWRTEVAWPGRNPLAPVESRGAKAGTRERANRDVARADTHPAVLAMRPAGPPAGADAHAMARAGEGLHAMRRPPLRSDNKSDERELVRGGDSAPDLPNGQRGRRPRKRRGLGLRVTVTGGFAGIAVIGFLVLGNLSPAAGGDTAAGTIAAVSTSQSPGTIPSSGVPTQALTDSGSRSTASSNASAATPSPGPSGTPDPSTTSAQTQQAKSPTTIRSGAQSSSPATQATTPPPTPSPSPSPSQTQVNCFLIICW